MRRRTLLGVWAHPDDEAYASAGLMAEFRRRGDRVVIIASMGGAPKNPQWLHNIKANPRVRVEIGSEVFEATAEVLTDGPERQRLFDNQAALMPNFKEYQEKTTRVIPVVALNRI